MLTTGYLWEEYEKKLIFHHVPHIFDMARSYWTCKYNCPQKTGKSLNNTIPGSKWSVIVMRIKQSEVYDKLSVTKFCVFLTRRGTVTNL